MPNEYTSRLSPVHHNNRTKRNHLESTRSDANSNPAERDNKRQRQAYPLSSTLVANSSCSSSVILQSIRPEIECNTYKNEERGTLKSDIRSNQRATIRLYEPKDRKSIEDFLYAGLEVDDTSSQKDKITRDLNHFDSQTQAQWPQFNKRFWVATLNNVVVGCVGILNTLMQRINDKKMITLVRLSVSKQNRRRGIGEQLLETVENYCKEQQIERIRVTTQTNLVAGMALYEKRGYKIVSNKRKTKTKSNKGLVKYELISFRPESEARISQFSIFSNKTTERSIQSQECGYQTVSPNL